MPGVDGRPALTGAHAGAYGHQTDRMRKRPRILAPPIQGLLGGRPRRGSLAAALVVIGVLGLAAPAFATTATIGNSLASDNGKSFFGCGLPCTVFQNTEPGAALTAPFDGTIVSWSYRSTDQGANYQLRVLHPVGGGQFRGAGTSAVTIVPDATGNVMGPIPVSLPVSAGDKIGLRVVSAPSGGAPALVSGSASDGVGYFSPDLADGATATPTIPGTPRQILVQATIQAAPPACQDVSASTPGNQAVNIPLRCTDSTGAPLTYSVDSGPSHGTAGLSGSSVTYTPSGGYTGGDSITYHAASANGVASSKTVSITVTPAPGVTTSPPTAVGTRSATLSASVIPNGASTTAHFEYGLDATYGSATAEQAAGADQASHTISTTVAGLLPNETYHVRAVATNGAGTVKGSDQVFKTAADPPPPPPVLGRSVNVRPVSGEVFVKPPPGATISVWGPQAWAAVLSPLLKGQGFVPLTEARQIPVGSTLDTSFGTVRLTTATASRKKLQAGEFNSGIFAVLQQRRQRGLTELRVVDSQTTSQACAPVGKAQSARTRLSSKVLGLLRGSAHGRFTTRGRFSAATVRGTIWGVRNRCDGTLTRVTRGVVVVRDFRRRKNITVRAGKTYLARAPGA